VILVFFYYQILFLLVVAFILMASVQDCDGRSPPKRTAKPSIKPRSRKIRSILAGQPGWMKMAAEDTIKDIDFFKPMFQGQPPNQFFPQPQYQQPMFPQQPQFQPQQFPWQQLQNQQQFYPNYQMNTQQQAMANQIAAAAAQYAHQLLASFLQPKMPNSNGMSNNSPVISTIAPTEAPTTEASSPEPETESPADNPDQSA
jgi:hypothetical protein